jgi:hypothetical protein
MDWEKRLTIGVAVATCITVAGILALICVEASRAGIRRQNPLDQMAVLYWNASTPIGAEYQWQGQYQFGASDWDELLVSGITIEPGDCLAYMQGITIGWRSCFVNDQGIVLKLEDGTDACNEAEAVEQFPEPCTRIYNMAGEEFDEDLVSRWNADHVSGNQ